MSTIAIEGVRRSFGSVEAVRDVTLRIEDGEFLTLLGPSGCGKTTLLRMIAGFTELDAGEVQIGGQRIDTLPPHRRNIGMVFQNYAIFPNHTVAGNVAYGLKARKVAPEEIAARVADALALVRLQGYGERWPHQLSGGQLQRVAIARALVIRPEVLLLDEPLSNLDARLRVDMRGEIRELQGRLDITTVYVTHDQEEALAVSHRIAVMQAGRIEQLGSPGGGVPPAGEPVRCAVHGDDQRAGGDRGAAHGGAGAGARRAGRAVGRGSGPARGRERQPVPASRGACASSAPIERARRESRASRPPS